MEIDLTFYKKCILTLTKAYEGLINLSEKSVEYEIYRSATVKEFEIIMEQSGKLLKKVLKPYFHSSKVVDQMPYKDLFRNAFYKGLLSEEECERWIIYRDNRNATAHDYGENFAEETLQLIPGFLDDCNSFLKSIQNEPNVT